jgi:hypothetical protein
MLRIKDAIKITLCVDFIIKVSAMFFKSYKSLIKLIINIFYIILYKHFMKSVWSFIFFITTLISYLFLFSYKVPCEYSIFLFTLEFVVLSSLRHFLWFFKFWYKTPSHVPNDPCRCSINIALVWLTSWNICYYFSLLLQRSLLT